MKFQRYYTLYVQTGDPSDTSDFAANDLSLGGNISLPVPTYTQAGDGSFVEGPTFDAPAVIISYPMTVRFHVSQRGTPSSGIATFDVYNLSEQNRTAIFHDINDVETYRRVVFAAGYISEPAIPVLFQGDIYQAYSYRAGPDWITHIEAQSGRFGISTGSINTPVPANYDFKQIIELLVQSMPYVNLGPVGNFESPNSRGFCLMGNSWDLLSRLVTPLNAQVYVHKELVHVLNQYEYIPSEGQPTTLTSDMGVIGSPIHADKRTTVRMIFEPRFELGTVVNLQTLTLQTTAKIMEINHRGTISGTVCDEAVSELTFYQGANGQELVEI